MKLNRMPLNRATLQWLGILSLLLTGPVASAQRQMEALNRGIVAVTTDEGIYMGWRLLGTDPIDIAFNLYRVTGAGEGEPVRLNDQPITQTTDFLDRQADRGQTLTYFVRPVHGSQEGEPSDRFTLPANAPNRPYLEVPLQTPEGYSPNDASVGDLDGDGDYEIVLHQTGRAHDNSHSGITDPPILQAYELDGTLLWEINLGPNIREGAHYTQFIVYDLDGDGTAEVACKTADGTVDGQGKTIGNPQANYVNESGRILSGPEYLTVFAGPTGAALDTVAYIPARGLDEHSPSREKMERIWDDDYGNRSDRFLATVAYLDGEHPSLVMCRGYYTRTFLVAWDFSDDELDLRWVFDSGQPRYKRYSGQGNHNLSVGDVDGDGRDEIMYGQMAVDDDGTGLYTTGIGHGDAIHLGQLNLKNPGLEVFSIQEPVGDAGAYMRDAGTGRILWAKPTAPGSDEGPGRGVCANIDPRHPGCEAWVAGGGLSNRLWDANGHLIATNTPSVNMLVWWDDDRLRELLDGEVIDEWDYENAEPHRLLTAYQLGADSNNGTKANPCLIADIFGDWREEVIWRHHDNQRLMIFTTTIPARDRLFTLMHDPQYRISIAWQNVAYNQPAHTSFFMDPAHPLPPRPDIKVVGAESGPQQ